MIEIGKLDRITAIIGERGTGKSELAKNDAREMQAIGSYVLGHSPNGAIGLEPDIAFHDSLSELEKGLAEDTSLMHFIASGASPEEVIEYGRSLARASRASAVGRDFKENRPAPPDTFASPVHIVIDEGTFLEKNPARRLKEPTKDNVKTDANMERFLTNARHEHVSTTWLIQAPSARSWTLTEQSNRIRVFRYVHEWGMNAVRAAGVPQAAIRLIPRLPKFQYVAWDKDDPNFFEIRKLQM